jgi:putative phage-type endonuclease
MVGRARGGHDTYSEAGMSAAENLIQSYVVEGNASGDRDTWLQRRSSGIGASEAAIILGVSGWGSILGLYYKKVNGEDPLDEESEEYIQWGTLLQDAILGELARRAGVTIAVREPHLRSTEHTWMLATPDALTTDGEPMECKNIAYGYDEDDWEVGIPEKYYLQCQQQMAVTGAKRCLFGVLLWGSRMIWEWVPRDEATIARIVKAGSFFWQRVLRREEPPADGHPEGRKILAKLAVVEHPIELYHNDVGDLLDEWQRFDRELSNVRQKERQAKRCRDAAADQIAQHMGQHRKAFTATGWSMRWKTSQRAGYQVKPTTINTFEITAPK